MEPHRCPSTRSVHRRLDRRHLRCRCRDRTGFRPRQPTVRHHHARCATRQSGADFARRRRTRTRIVANDHRRNRFGARCHSRPRRRTARGCHTISDRPDRPIRSRWPRDRLRRRHRCGIDRRAHRRSPARRRVRRDHGFRPSPSRIRPERAVSTHALAGEHHRPRRPAPTFRSS